ncbi:hypothetical protein ABZU25_17515 [Micromonospora sp. NPDC005215]|uniref:hypothetical protein n=1 Tax=Micromonospora sp. NPDC005215 TaxID=3157024 RepID=UPI0033AA5046
MQQRDLEVIQCGLAQSTVITTVQVRPQGPSSRRMPTLSAEPDVWRVPADTGQLVLPLCSIPVMHLVVCGALVKNGGSCWWTAARPTPHWAADAAKGARHPLRLPAISMCC